MYSNIRLGPDPFHTSTSIQSREVVPDRTLQEVVNKIFPWLKAKEEEEERDFYVQRGIELKPEYVQDGKAHHGRDRGRSSSGKTKNVAIGSMDDMLDLHMEPDGQPPYSHQRLPQLRRPKLCMSGRAKIITIKKYLVQKLGLKDSKNSIEILCNGDRMGDELSLTFISRTRWFSSNKCLSLKYRLEEENRK
ncbi:hypothetical protein ACHAXR_012398 [Thalassiosira sp. AJA248-18]